MNGTCFFTANDGSHAWGMQTPASDWDLKVIYIAPIEKILSGSTVANHDVKTDRLDMRYIEMGAFVHQLAKGNANAYIQLFSPVVRCSDRMRPFLNELRGIAVQNLSKEIVPSVEGITLNTVKRILKDTSEHRLPKRLRLCTREMRTVLSAVTTGTWRFDPVVEEITEDVLREQLDAFKIMMAETSLIPDHPSRPGMYDDFIIALRVSAGAGFLLSARHFA